MAAFQLVSEPHCTDVMIITTIFVLNWFLFAQIFINYDNVHDDLMLDVVESNKKTFHVDSIISRLPEGNVFVLLDRILVHSSK